MNTSQNSKKILSREVWREGKAIDGQKDEDAEWGWLTIYSDHSFEFDTSERPTTEDIKNRTGCWTTGHGL